MAGRYLRSQWPRGVTTMDVNYNIMREIMSKVKEITRKREGGGATKWW